MSTPTMEEGREHAIKATHELISSLAALGLRPEFADGTYSECAGPAIAGHLGWKDDAGVWQYATKGRFDLPEGQFGSSAVARDLRDALVADGWEPRSGFLGSIDGIQDADSRQIVRADRGDVSIEVNCYVDRPFVLFQVLGPCLATTTEQRKKYMRAETDRFDVGGGEP